MLIPLGVKGLKVRGGAVNKYCHESHIFQMFESHQLDVLGGFTPLQVHLLTPLHMQYGV